jgi:hypothetical protein
MTWFYLSFAGDDGWRGGAFVDGDTILEAVTMAGLLGINPGGEALVIEVPDGLMDAKVPERDRRRLLTREEVEQLEETIDEH